MEVLTDCLASLQQTAADDVEIILVDNGSTDDSISVVAEKYPAVRIVSSPENCGYAGGCNLGADQAGAPFLLFLNNDTVHNEGWIDKLQRILASDDKISSVQPKILNYFHKDHFDYAGGCGGFMDLLVFPFVRGRIFDTVEEDRGQYDDPREIFWASGTAFLTRSDIFRAMGGFDETLFAHMEEIDYHWRCHLAGYRVVVEPGAVVYHRGAVTLPPSSPLKTYLNHRNSFLLLLTNYNPINSFFLFFPRLFLELMSFCRELVSLRPQHAHAHIRSLFWLLTHPQIISRRRRSLRTLRKISDEEVLKKIYQRILVVQYYLGRKRKFSQIYQRPVSGF